MKRITIAIALLLTAGIFFTSCNDKQKSEVNKAATEVKKDAEKVENVVEKDAKKVGNAVEKEAKKVGKEMDKGVEKVKEDLAMNDYQCPMKCEGDKVYHKPGKCPKCKMDLKKINKK